MLLSNSLVVLASSYISPTKNAELNLYILVSTKYVLLLILY